ncbi:MAG: V-type ATP synthase subunit E family protein [Candidatus Nanohalobium sp.]
MGLEEVKSDILEDARQEADEIIEEAEEEKKEILEDANQEAEKIREDSREEISEEKEALRKKRLPEARMKAKQEKLQAKQDELDKVFENFRETLESLDKEELEAFYESVMEKVDFDVGLVEGSEEFEDFVDERKRDFKVVDKPGVVLVSEDGSLRRDFSFESVVDDFRENFRKDVAGVLFPEVEE